MFFSLLKDAAGSAMDSAKDAAGSAVEGAKDAASGATDADKEGAKKQLKQLVRLKKQ